MAGIAGIISLRDRSVSELDKFVFSRMMSALKNYDDQVGKSYNDESIFCANALPVSTKHNERFVVNKQLGIVSAVDGFIHIAEDLKTKLRDENSLPSSFSEYELIPYLYKKYGPQTACHITGSFNLFCYDLNTGKTLVTNDRFGFLPLYCYRGDSFFVFGSKIECILASGLCKQIDFDRVTITEHLFFNYPLSENTYIKGIETLSNATTLTIGHNAIKQDKYWSIGDDFTQYGLSAKDSFDLVDSSLHHAIEKTASTTEGKLNFSLTGGWDSRVVLAYLLPEYLDRLHCYSFGARDSDDIQIPLMMAGKEKLNYTPFILDDRYLRDSFLPAARKTIELSGGTRNFKRAHYLYAIQKLGLISDTLITGIFGDEVLKVGRPQGGAVLSKHTIAMIDHDFDTDDVIAEYARSQLSSLPGYSDKAVVDEFSYRISELKHQFNDYSTLSEKYIALRFEINLRKYFGNEASSYNDYVYCHSPFIDYGFLKEWLKTKYAGQRFEFSSSDLKTKKQSSDLYTKLVMRRYPALAHYPSSRGYSMSDTWTLVGRSKVLFRKYIRRTDSPKDGFNTSATEELFESMLKKEITRSDCPIDLSFLENGSTIKTDALSLAYWMHQVRKKYL